MNVFERFSGVAKVITVFVVLALSIITLGLAAVIYECVFAHEISEQLRLRGHKQPLANLTAWVIGLNVAAGVLSLTGVGIILAVPCGLAATCLVQAEFNKLSLGAYPRTRALKVLWKGRAQDGRLAGTGGYVLTATVTLQDGKTLTQFRRVGLVRGYD